MGFVRIYVKDVSALGEEALPWLMERISPERRALVERRKPYKDKIRCAVAEVLLWTALTELGEDICDYEVCYGSSGQDKPYLVGRESGLDFSFSHSGDYVVCALSDAPVGVDVQEETRRGAIFSPHIFSEAELSRMTEEEFYIAWTCKEAFIKCAAAEHPTLRSAELALSDMPYPITNRRDGGEFYFATEQLDERHTLSYCVHTGRPPYVSLCLL